MQFPAVFLDKDGTLVPDIPYNIDPERITLEDGAAQALRRLAGAGYRLVIVSNQSGVARGLFDEGALRPVIDRVRGLLETEAGVRVDGFYYCPHHPQGCVPEYSVECACRKPEPGMLLAAAHDLNLRLEDSWMVGDILNDVEAGKRAGCRAILIDNGGETEWVDGDFRKPDFIAANLPEAAEWILSGAGWQERRNA
jgi:D,D-heptose 1,7-bisphosphate phosphatase